MRPIRANDSPISAQNRSAIRLKLSPRSFATKSPSGKKSSAPPAPAPTDPPDRTGSALKVTSQERTRSTLSCGFGWESVPEGRPGPLLRSFREADQVRGGLLGFGGFLLSLQLHAEKLLVELDLRL